LQFAIKKGVKNVAISNYFKLNLDNEIRPIIIINEISILMIQFGITLLPFLEEMNSDSTFLQHRISFQTKRNAQDLF